MPGETRLHVEDRSALKRSAILGRLVIASVALLALSGDKPAPMVASPPASALSAAERQALDLDRYVVTNSFGQLLRRRDAPRLCSGTFASLLRAAAERLAAEVNCEEKLALPVVDDELRLPSFYEEQEAWRAAIEPLFTFEDAVSDLARVRCDRRGSLRRVPARSLGHMGGGGRAGALPLRRERYAGMVQRRGRAVRRRRGTGRARSGDRPRRRQAGASMPAVTRREEASVDRRRPIELLQQSSLSPGPVCEHHRGPERRRRAVPGRRRSAEVRAARDDRAWRSAA